MFEGEFIVISAELDCEWCSGYYESDTGIAYFFDFFGGVPTCEFLED